jgi:hypothetical protein
MAEAWTLTQIEKMISGRVQEDIHLDYKAAGALDRSDKKKDELSKDVSAFANADGGTLIYGIREDSNDRSLPGSIDPIDSRAFSQEWLEQIVTSRIQPKIPGLLVTTIEVSPHQVVYVVDIPKGETAHQASDRKYHKRQGITTEAMWDYEVRDIMNRKTTPKVSVEVSIVRQFRELKDAFVLPHLTGGSDPFSRRTAPPAKKYETLEWLRVRAINEGGLVINYLNVFVQLDPPAKAPTRVKGKVEQVAQINCDNTIRDIVDVHFTPGFVGGSSSASPKYGPSRYDPILPGLSLRLLDTPIVAGSVSPNAIIKWKAHADNANAVTGEIVASTLSIVEE